MKNLIFLIIVLFSNLFFFNLRAQNSSSGMMQSIQQSHIEGNVPAAKDFAPFLTRDLGSYFSKELKQKVTVKYNLLREGPTQAGVAYPKYYAWVKIFRGATLLSEGAVRLAAIEKTHFEITDFLDKAAIQKDPDQVKKIFPAVLYEKILAQAK